MYWVVKKEQSQKKSRQLANKCFFIIEKKNWVAIIFVWLVGNAIENTRTRKFSLYMYYASDTIIIFKIEEKWLRFIGFFESFFFKSLLFDGFFVFYFNVFNSFMNTATCTSWLHEISFTTSTACLYNT